MYVCSFNRPQSQGRPVPSARGWASLLQGWLLFLFICCRDQGLACHAPPTRSGFGRPPFLAHAHRLSHIDRSRDDVALCGLSYSYEALESAGPVILVPIGRRCLVQVVLPDDLVFTDAVPHTCKGRQKENGRGGMFLAVQPRERWRETGR